MDEKKERTGRLQSEKKTKFTDRGKRTAIMCKKSTYRVPRSQRHLSVSAPLILELMNKKKKKQEVTIILKKIKLKSKNQEKIKKHFPF